MARRRREKRVSSGEWFRPRRSQKPSRDSTAVMSQLNIHSFSFVLHYRPRRGPRALPSSPTTHSYMQDRKVNDRRQQDAASLFLFSQAPRSSDILSGRSGGRHVSVDIQRFSPNSRKQLVVIAKERRCLPELFADRWSRSRRDRP